MRVGLVLFALACTAEPAPLPVAQSGVRVPLELHVLRAGVRRTDLQIVVRGAIPGSQIRVFATDATTSSTPHAPCDPLEPDCVGLDDGTGPFDGLFHLPPATADSQGAAEWDVHVHPSVPLGDYTVQAVEVGGPRSDFVSATISRRPTEYMLMTLGYTSACGLTPQGAAVCWPSSGDGELKYPAIRWKDFDLGIFAGCGIGMDDQLRCWTGQDFTLPVPNIDAVAVSAGNQQHCALDAAGVATCWGYDSGYWEQTHPGPYAQVVASWQFSCGLRTSGEVDCWGSNPAVGHTPTGTFQSLSGHDHSMCGRRTDRSHVCWDRHGAEDIPGRYSAYSGGTLTFCGVRRSDRGLSCFSRPPNTALLQDTPPGEFRDVTVGYTSACATRMDGSIACWGYSSGGDVDPPFLGASQDTGDTGM